MAEIDTKSQTLTDARDGWRITINTAHPLVQAAEDSGVPLRTIPWLEEALKTLRSIQDGLGCTEEEALSVLNEGGTWAFLTRD